MHNQEEEYTDFESFEQVFEQAEKRDGHWIERAKLEFTREVLDAMTKRGVSRTELASRLNVRPGMVTRLLTGKNNFELATMVRLAKALGCRFRSHLHLAEHNCMWMDVLKEEPKPANVIPWDPSIFKKVEAFEPSCEKLDYVPIAVNSR
jgi:plasmid maintenance system antidote protein VapI